MDEINKKLALAEDSLKGSGELVYGIRPEDIREIKEGDTAKDVFPIRVAVAELLGHEYYVHGDFAGIDLVSKIPLTHEIKIGDPLKIAFDETKAHIFDPVSEKIIY
jgi:multiple sugar transport system ATP-binding protein